MGKPNPEIMARTLDTAEGPVAEGFKRCGAKPCRRIKPVGAFWRNRSHPDGRQRRCIVCMKLAATRYAKSTKGKATAKRYRDRPENAVKRKMINDSERVHEAEKARAKTPRGRLIQARKHARIRAKNPNRSAAVRSQAAELVKTLDGCIAAFDPADGKPIPKNATRCPGCMVPKPLRTMFYREPLNPLGYSSLCRRCKPGGPERKHRYEKAQRNTEHGVKAARRRKANQRERKREKEGRAVE